MKLRTKRQFQRWIPILIKPKKEPIKLRKSLIFCSPKKPQLTKSEKNAQILRALLFPNPLQSEILHQEWFLPANQTVK